MIRLRLADSPDSTLAASQSDSRLFIWLILPYIVPEQWQAF